MAEEIIQYRTSGVCCGIMQVKVNNGIVIDADFYGGCNGNLQGIKNLIKGMEISQVIQKLSGIRCGDKNTSCPDQLAKCLLAYKNKEVETLTIKS